ncbi:MAG: RNB domain-containing ribonuclease, partial [Deltaproteobacteria bacterium]|nr:RNB domain-containing ribonuclease [Deltaproteobacteria bacterium]
MSIRKGDNASLVTPEGLEALLRQVRHPLRLDDILRMAALPRRSKGAVLDALESLEAEGRIFRLRGGKWTDAGQVKTITGVLSVQRSGSGFLTMQAGNESTRDVFIPAALMGDALHGDTAEAILLPGRSAPAHGLAAEARIVRVVRRGAKMLAARVIGPKAYLAAPSDASMHRQRSAARPLPPAEGLYAAPADPHFPILLDVDCSALPHAPKKGTLLLAELLGRRPDGVWNAAASSLLENEHSAEVQERLTRLNHMIPFDFPPDVAAEAAGLEEALSEACPEKPSGSTGQRIDLRDLPFVTIDGPDARDFDDAICVEGNTLWVASADVSLYVRPRSALDREALARGNSCYFPCSVTPMLPEKLCNDLCSLRANRSRPVLAARLTCNEKGLADSADFFPAVILPRANLTYEGVQAMLDGNDEAPSPECPLPDAALAPMLRQAAGLAARMIENRARRGALDLDLTEAGFLFDENGHVCGITRRARLFAHRLIEAFMLAANEAAAAFLTQKKEPFPLRAHPAPDRERLESL